jgi:hypothetical protein
MSDTLNPGDIAYIFSGLPHVDDKAVVLGPSPCWWRARLSDGTTYDFEASDVDWSTTRSANRSITRIIETGIAGDKGSKQIEADVREEVAGLTDADIEMFFHCAGIGRKSD